MEGGGIIRAISQQLQLQSPLSIHLHEDRARTPKELATQNWKIGRHDLPMRPPQPNRTPPDLRLPHLGPHQTQPNRAPEDLDGTRSTDLQKDRPGKGRHHRRRGGMVHDALRSPWVTLAIPFIVHNSHWSHI